MTTYNVVAKVDQIVTKKVDFIIDANSEEEAQKLAYDALQEYPKGVTVKEIKRVLTVNATYWIPKTIDFITIKEVKENASK